MNMRMDELNERRQAAHRRDFLKGSALGLGGIALQGLLSCGRSARKAAMPAAAGGD